MGSTTSTTHPGIFHDVHLLPRFDAKLVVANKRKFKKNKANSQQPIAKSQKNVIFVGAKNLKLKFYELF